MREGVTLTSNRGVTEVRCEKEGDGGALLEEGDGGAL